MEVWVICALVLAGIIVGVINTFAGAGATISLALYSLLGLDLSVANATNRISVVFQCATMSGEFYRQGKLDIKLGLLLSIPTSIGAVIGSELVGYLSNTLFSILIGVALLIMLLVLIFDPTRALKGREKITRPNLLHYIILLFIGFYGGAFHLGVGYLFLSLFILGLGYDILTANALKGFVVLIYTLFAVGVFAINGEIVWSYGLIHSIGNIIGAYFATRYSQYIPIQVLRYSLMVFILLTVTYIFVFKI